MASPQRTCWAESAGWRDSRIARGHRTHSSRCNRVFTVLVDRTECQAGRDALCHAIPAAIPPPCHFRLDLHTRGVHTRRQMGNARSPLQHVGMALRHGRQAPLPPPDHRLPKTTTVTQFTPSKTLVINFAAHECRTFFRPFASGTRKFSGLLGYPEMWDKVRSGEIHPIFAAVQIDVIKNWEKLK